MQCPANWTPGSRGAVRGSRSAWTSAARALGLELAVLLEQGLVLRQQLLAGLGERAGHAVDRPAGGGQLVATVLRQARLQVAAGDLAGGPRERADRPRQLPTDQQRGER
jgi:hypothetical protein